MLESAMQSASKNKSISSISNIFFTWPRTVAERLNDIDNNIDLVELMLKEVKNHTLE